MAGRARGRWLRLARLGGLEALRPDADDDARSGSEGLALDSGGLQLGGTDGARPDRSEKASAGSTRTESRRPHPARRADDLRPDVRGRRLELRQLEDARRGLAAVPRHDGDRAARPRRPPGATGEPAESRNTAANDARRSVGTRAGAHDS